MPENNAAPAKVVGGSASPEGAKLPLVPGSESGDPALPTRPGESNGLAQPVSSRAAPSSMGGSLGTTAAGGLTPGAGGGELRSDGLAAQVVRGEATRSENISNRSDTGAASRDASAHATSPSTSGTSLGTHSASNAVGGGGSGGVSGGGGGSTLENRSAPLEIKLPPAEAPNPTVTSPATQQQVSPPIPQVAPLTPPAQAQPPPPPAPSITPEQVATLTKQEPNLSRSETLRADTTRQEAPRVAERREERPSSEIRIEPRAEIKPEARQEPRINPSPVSTRLEEPRVERALKTETLPLTPHTHKDSALSQVEVSARSRIQETIAQKSEQLSQTSKPIENSARTPQSEVRQTPRVQEELSRVVMPSRPVEQREVVSNVKASATPTRQPETFVPKAPTTPNQARALREVIPQNSKPEVRKAVESPREKVIPSREASTKNQTAPQAKNIEKLPQEKSPQGKVAQEKSSTADQKKGAASKEAATRPDPKEKVSAKPTAPEKAREKAAEKAPAKTPQGKEAATRSEKDPKVAKEKQPSTERAAKPHREAAAQSRDQTKREASPLQARQEPRATRVSPEKLTSPRLMERLKQGEGTPVEKITREVVRFVKLILRIPDNNEQQELPPTPQQAVDFDAQPEETSPQPEDQTLELERTLSPEEPTVDATQVGEVYSIRGRVLEFATGQPISGVSLHIDGIGLVRTDSRGEYEFENLSYGARYLLQIDSSSYDFTPSSAKGVITGHAHHLFFGKLRAL